jgi:quercetin dioxygenase-like cupin family protein
LFLKGRFMSKYFSVMLAVIFAAALARFALASSGPTIVMSGQEHWTAGTGLMKGAQVAVLAGNPAKAGLFIVRFKLSAGTVFGPHYHTQIEDVTVVSGTLWVGLGDKVNKAEMTALPAGSFVQVPAMLHHYAVAKTPTIIDITAIGPLSMTAVKP